MHDIVFWTIFWKTEYENIDWKVERMDRSNKGKLTVLTTVLQLKLFEAYTSFWNLKLIMCTTIEVCVCEGGGGNDREKYIKWRISGKN